MGIRRHGRRMVNYTGLEGHTKSVERAAGLDRLPLPLRGTGLRFPGSAPDPRSSLPVHPRAREYRSQPTTDGTKGTAAIGAGSSGPGMTPEKAVMLSSNAYRTKRETIDMILPPAVLPHLPGLTGQPSDMPCTEIGRIWQRLQGCCRISSRRPL